MSKHLLGGFLLVMAMPVWAASFDCDKAGTPTEKQICADSKLSRLDGKMATFYQMVYEKVAQPDKLKAEQIDWLAERDLCTDVACLERMYDRRIDNLRVLAARQDLRNPLPAMAPEEIERVYVEQRKVELKAFFKDRKLELSKKSRRNPLCADFLHDFTAQNEAIQLIPPTIVVHDYDDPLLRERLFSYCPGLELRSYKIGMSGPYIGPRNFLQYQVDIDNDVANGEEHLFVEEAMRMRWPDYGPEIVVKNVFRLINLSTCESRGFASIGASRRYPLDFNVFDESPETGLHGVLRYQGKNYLYDVIDGDPKAPPLGLVQYGRNDVSGFETACLFLNALPDNSFRK